MFLDLIPAQSRAVSSACDVGVRAAGVPVLLHENPLELLKQHFHNNFLILLIPTLRYYVYFLSIALMHFLN